MKTVILGGSPDTDDVVTAVREDFIRVKGLYMMVTSIYSL